MCRRLRRFHGSAGVQRIRVWGSVAYASRRSFLGYFAFSGDNPIALVSCLPSIPASRFLSFYVRPHPSRTMRGGARFEVGWAARTRGGCPGCRFGVQGWFSASVSVRVRVCWASRWPRERWCGGDWRHRAVRPRHFRGVSGPSPGWCSLTWELTQAPPFPFSRRPWFPSVSFSCLLG